MRLALTWYRLEKFNRIVYVVLPDNILDTALVTAYSLLLSNDIRRDIAVLAAIKYKDLSLKVVIDSRFVKHLRMDQDSLEGFFKRLLRKPMPGVNVVHWTRVFELGSFNTCLILDYTSGYSITADLKGSLETESITLCDLLYGRMELRGRVFIIILGREQELNDRFTCKRVVVVKNSLMQPWYTVATVMVVLDEVGGTAKDY